MDPDQDKRVDRRTFLKRGLVAGGLLAGAGLAIGDLGRGRRRFRVAAERALARRGAAHERRAGTDAPEHPRDHRRPAALPAVVLDPRRAALACRPTSQRLRAGAVSFARHYTASNDCSPGARGAADRPLHAPDRLHDHRRQHARPRLSDLGDDAARARLPHALVRQVASHPPRQHWWIEVDGERALERLRLLGRHLPLARRRPRARAGAWTRTSPASSPTGSPTRAARSRGARPSRSSIRTTSPGGTRGATASPAEARAARVVARPAAELRDAGAADRAQQAAAAALAPGHRGGLVRAGPLHRARRRRQVAGIPRPLHEAPARGRPPRRPRAAQRSRAARRSPRTR